MRLCILSQVEIDLSSGDRLVLYTDGLIEVFNQSDEMLGVEGLQDLADLSQVGTSESVKCF